MNVNTLAVLEIASLDEKRKIIIAHEITKFKKKYFYSGIDLYVKNVSCMSYNVANLIYVTANLNISYRILIQLHHDVLKILKRTFHSLLGTLKLRRYPFIIFKL